MSKCHIVGNIMLWLIYSIIDPAEKMFISESTSHVYVPTSHAGIQLSLIDVHMQLSDPVGFCMNLYFFIATFKSSGETAKNADYLLSQKTLFC